MWTDTKASSGSGIQTHLRGPIWLQLKRLKYARSLLGVGGGNRPNWQRALD